MFYKIKKEISDVIKIFNLIFKNYFFSFNNLYIYIISFSVLVSFCVVIPLIISTSTLLGVSILSCSLITYCSSFYTIHNSSIYKNLLTSEVKKSSIYGTIFLFMIFNNFILFIFLFSFSAFFFQVGLLSNELFLIGSPKFNLNGIFTDFKIKITFYRVLVIIYYLISISTILFLLSVLIQYFTTSYKNYFLIGISIVILSIIFGGFFSYYTRVEPIGVIDNLNMVYSIDLNDPQIKNWSFDESNNKLFINYYPFKSKITQINEHYFVSSVDEGAIWKNSILGFVSLFFPTFGINNSINSVFTQTFFDSSKEVTFIAINNGIDPTIINPDYIDFNFLFFSSNNLKYGIQFYSVFIWIPFLFSMIVIFRKRQKMI